MSNVHTIINVRTNEAITDQKVTTANFRDICRAWLMEPEHFGERLQVIRNRTAEDPGQVIFDVTNIKYSSGQVRMTLYTEYQRQQALHEQTAKKAAEREAAKAKKLEEKAATKAEKVEEPKAEEQPVKAAKKNKKAVKKAAKIAAE